MAREALMRLGGRTGEEAHLHVRREAEQRHGGGDDERHAPARGQRNRVREDDGDAVLHDDAEHVGDGAPHGGRVRREARGQRAARIGVLHARMRELSPAMR
jgi:hypothetical protein